MRENFLEDFQKILKKLKSFDEVSNTFWRNNS